MTHTLSRAQHLQRSIKRITLSLAAAIFFSLPALAANPSFSFDEKAGLPAIHLAGASLMRAQYDYFADNWSWQYAATKFSIDSPRHYSFTGTVAGLGLDFKGNAISADTANTANWTATYTASTDKSPVIGGGITFLFDLANFSNIMGEPELLADNKGWIWGSPQTGKFVRMEFALPLSDIYFERGQKNQIRAKFFSNSISAGTYVFNAQITSSGVDMAATQQEKFGLVDPSTWPTTPITWDSSAVDLSFLNAQDKPAGRRGFVKARGDNLVFSSGGLAKFWGTNISAYSLFKTSDENIFKQAKRLSALGFNLVRLHHHDSTWVAPNIFGSAFTDTKSINLESRRKINLWVKALKDEGIYTWLDLQVGREVLAGDQVFGFSEISKGKTSASVKGYRYINTDIQNLMMAFATDYLTSVNEYTGLSFANDPAIVTVLISNEDDLTRHFGNALLPDKNVPLHNKIYMDEAQAFASKWALPYTATWKSWLHGPSKLFLNDLEQRFNAKMVAHLKSIGVQVPIVTGTQWGGNGLSSLPSVAAGDMVDVHSYAPAGQLNVNPIYSPNITDWISAASVVNKPLSVSEWNNEPFPAPDRHTTPIWLAAKGAHQGWDSLLQYAYAQEAMNGGAYIKASNWHAYTDPSLLATMPAAALMFRRGDVREGFNPLVYSPGAQELFGTEITPWQAPAIRTASEIYKVQVAMPAVKELPWLQASARTTNQTLFSNRNALLIDSNQLAATSDTQELTRNWDKGIYLVNTPKSQAIIGFIGGSQYNTKYLQTNITTNNASIVVQSLDNNFIDVSDQLLISIGTRSEPKSGATLPYYVEPLSGAISIRAKPGLKAYINTNTAISAASPATATATATSATDNSPTRNIPGATSPAGNADGTGTEPLPATYPMTYSEGKYQIKFDGTAIVTWLTLK
jgi:hypothetical protein